MRLALDHHFSPKIAAALRARGHDVVGALERNWNVLGDEDLLSVCSDEQRALATNDIGDFALLARRWTEEGRPHAGLVFTSDSSMPRNSGGIGPYVEALDALMSTNPAEGALADRIHWLRESVATSDPE